MAPSINPGKEDDAREEAKYQGLDAEAIRRIQARNYATSLKVWWSREFGYLCLLDPFTGEVYEVANDKVKTPRWLAWRAMDEKQRRLAEHVRRAPAPVPAGPVPHVPADGRSAEEGVPVRVW